MEPLVYCNEGCGKTYARINRNTPHSNRYGASVAETTYNIIYTSGMYSRFSCFENFHILITESRKHFRQYVTAGSRQHCKYNDYPVKLCLFIIKIGTCPLPCRSVGNLLYPPHGREYEDCKQILKLSLILTHTLKRPARLQPGKPSEDLP